MEFIKIVRSEEERTCSGHDPKLLCLGVYYV